MYSVNIYSDDGTLAGNVEDKQINGFISYIARVWDIRRATPAGRGAILIEAKSFGTGTTAENWMLDKLECPLFTLLAK